MTTAAINQAEPNKQSDALPPGRQAGVCLHLTSLPGPYGIGGLGAEARKFIDFMAAAGINVWQFLPVGPTDYGDSPYQPLSSFAGNEMLIDMGTLLDLELLLVDEMSPLEALPTDEVDYGRLIPIKKTLLQRAASRFKDKAPDFLKRRHAEFLARHDASWLHDYALFRALKDKHDGRPWTQWKKRFAKRRADALEEFADSHADEIETVKIIQFLFYAQWQDLHLHAEKRGVWLFGDMPIYIGLDSADAWSNRELLQLDDDGNPLRVAGVPPDYFSADGQLWGNPLYDWEYHGAQDFAWWVERVRHATELAHLVRIDHFRGFESYWSVPAGEDTARNGHWVPGPGDRLFDALRKALGHLPIIAEDLGVITPEVEALRDRQHLPGMVVLQFAIGDENFRYEDMPENRVCYTGTHDNDTTMGWFNGGHADTRSAEEIARLQQTVLEITGGSPESVHTDLIRLAMGSNARLAIVPMQDFLGLGSEARFNTPGKGDSNWRWRLGADDLTEELGRELRALTEAGARGA